MSFAPADDHFAERVSASFNRQAFMATIGASISRLAPGEVDIGLTVHPNLTQQHGFVHAAVVAAIADSACGYAAFTLMPADAAVLTVEYKINLMDTAHGVSLVARAKVVRPGRTLTVCEATVFAVEASGEERPVALLIATVMALLGRPGIQH